VPVTNGITDYYSGIGDSISMNVSVDANPLRVTFVDWINYDVVLTDKVDTLSTSTVFINEVTEFHFGVYNITAHNDIGSVVLQVNLHHAGVPEAPVSLEIIDRSYDSLSILLSPGYDGGYSGNTAQYLEYRSTSQASFQSWPSDGMGTRNTTIWIMQLKPSTAYEIKAKTGNIYGIGQFSTTYVFITYREPIVNLNDQTGIIKWTRHEDMKYQCVKIEKLERNDNWIIEENCLDRDVVEYTVKDNNAEYRVTYCSRDNTCEGHHFKATKGTDYADRVESCNTVAIVIGVLVSLLGGCVIGFLIGFILIKRVITKNAKQ
ncbi:neural cell adhesion molecule 2-like, partial [Saccoglossus kowalevskii]